MNTDFVFSVNGTDFSEYVTQNDLRLRYTPVYDAESEYTSLDGNAHKTLLGFTADITAAFSALPDEAARSLSSILNSDSYSVTFAFPDKKEANFHTLSLSMEPERISDDICYWSAFLSVRSELLPLDGL